MNGIDGFYTSKKAIERLYEIINKTRNSSTMNLNEDRE
jgi:hypothetical protein